MENGRINPFCVERKWYMKEKKHKQYNLLTVICMIVGICIGSGIFFKSDNILVATNGSIALGVLSFVLAAIAIIFGSLTIAELASRTDETGGLVTYAQEFIDSKTACGFGWFQVLIYYPTITIVVAWVVGVYIDILFYLQASLELQMLIGFVFLLICFVYNLLLPHFASFVQDSTTFLKLLPLFLLGILGMLFGDPIQGFASTSPTTFMSAGWLSALGPIAYSFDGWIVSTSIAHEVKNSKKTMPKALSIAPLIILAIYTLYFVGVSCYVGPEEVMRLGDAHVSVAASRLLGNTFSKAITIFVVISVMGTVNGLVMGYIRMPYSLALREHMIPFSKYLKQVNKTFDMPIYSGIFSFIICVIWMIIHYFCTKYNILGQSDVSEIAISVSYILYIVLYIKVIILYKQKVITHFFKGVICPIMAIVGSLIILSGAIQNPMFIAYVGICVVIYIASQIYYIKSK